MRPGVWRRGAWGYAMPSWLGGYEASAKGTNEGRKDGREGGGEGRREPNRHS